MIKASEIKKIVNDYSDVKIGVLGSHSALEVMDGAKDENFETTVFCQKGREGPYQRFNRIADQIVVLDKFKDMASAKNQKMLRDSNTIVVPHRSLTVYLGYKTIEDKFKVPIFGNRKLFQAEERTAKKGQYYLLEKARIKYPKLFKDPKRINKPSIVKVQEKKRPLERAFFTVSSYKDYKEKSEEKIKQGVIARKDLEKASIEELAIGTYMNFNFFHTPISNQVDFIGIESEVIESLQRLEIMGFLESRSLKQTSFYKKYEKPQSREQFTSMMEHFVSYQNSEIESIKTIPTIMSADGSQFGVTKNGLKLLENIQEEIDRISMVITRIDHHDKIRTLQHPIARQRIKKLEKHVNKIMDVMLDSYKDIRSNVALQEYFKTHTEKLNF